MTAISPMAVKVKPQAVVSSLPACWASCRLFRTYGWHWPFDHERVRADPDAGLGWCLALTVNSRRSDDDVVDVAAPVSPPGRRAAPAIRAEPGETGGDGLLTVRADPPRSFVGVHGERPREEGSHGGGLPMRDGLLAGGLPGPVPAQVRPGRCSGSVPAWWGIEGRTIRSCGRGGVGRDLVRDGDECGDPGFVRGSGLVDGIAVGFVPDDGLAGLVVPVAKTRAFGGLDVQPVVAVPGPWLHDGLGHPFVVVSREPNWR